MNTSVAFHTLGCKLNFSETSTLERRLEDKGFEIKSSTDRADIYVLNTCSVTEFADRKCRKLVSQFRRTNPKARVVVMGCYAQLKPKEIAELPGVNLVLGASEKFNLEQHLELLQWDDPSVVRGGEIGEVEAFESAFSYGSRTRSFLKIQDGCDYKCTFCTIPLARGRSRSDRVDNILHKAETIASLGVREIVLTGVNIGDFGNGTHVIEGARPKKGDTFIDLIRELEGVSGIARFRISSIEPNLCSDEIIDFVASSTRFAPHFHMPLQSGNNKQLRQMKRRYTRELYADRVAHIKGAMPHACIGVDVIVGFPGETDEDFLETYSFLDSLDVSYLHVFTYSQRVNTAADMMDDQVPMEKRRKRNEMLRGLSEIKKITFYQEHLGQERPVLYEESKEANMLSGYTDNYIKIYRSYEDNLLGTIQRVKLDEQCLAL